MTPERRERQKAYGAKHRSAEGYRERHNEAQRKWVANNVERNRANRARSREKHKDKINAAERLKRLDPKHQRSQGLLKIKKYGLRIPDFEMLERQQCGRCAICDKVPAQTTRSKRLTVDHCHVTGSVRGLLCGRCNTAIGMAGDNVAVLRSMILYLERSRYLAEIP